MKKTFRILMAAFVLTATFGLTACDPDQDKPTPEPIENYEPSSTYALYVGDTEIPVGDTYTYTATNDDLNNDEIVVYFIIENKTTSPAPTSHKFELVEGPTAFNGYEVCAGDTCPWDGKPYIMQPGKNPTKPIKYDIIPSECPAGSSALYKLTVGRGNGLSDPQVIFFRLNL